MKKYLKPGICLISLLFLEACNNVSPPAAYGPVPTQNQIEWHEMEYFGLVCYGLNTYTRQEWGYGDIDPKVFNPENLDTDQWARIAKESGMKGLILVAKHHDGFCLWPSKTTDYTVAATPWKDGKGDVLGDLAESCKKYELKLGVYISPWDRNHAEYGRPGYVKDYHEQWREVLEYSDDIFEVWFDGANGGTGYYGGARESRKIEKGYYQFPEIFKLIKEKQPRAIFFGYVEDITQDVVRWGGTEEGTGSETNWCRFDDPTTGDIEIMKTGLKNGKYWMPVEGNTTILSPKKWYYNESSQPRTLKNFVDLYYTTIGQNATFNLGLSIGPSGKIPERDVKSMLAQKRQIDKELAENLAKNMKITSDNERDKSTFNAENVLDESTKTYWATKDGVQKASLILDFEKETTFNRLLLQEYIQLGQRVHKFTLEIETDHDWKEVAHGTTIGYKRILRFDNVTSKKARVTIETDALCLTLANLEIYNAPPLLAEPGMIADIEGNIVLQATDELSIYYALGDDSSGSNYKEYTSPIHLPYGGTIRAYTKHSQSDHKSGIVSQKFGMAKKEWKIHGAQGGNTNANQPSNAIDANTGSYWETTGEVGNGNHYIAINLGKQTGITGFSYIPPDLGVAGAIFEYEFYASKDGKHWGEPISKGEFSNIENNPIAQRVTFKQVVQAKYIKLVSVSAVKNHNKTVINEIELFTN